MNDSKKRILDMLAEGKISASEAADLLDALEEDTSEKMTIAAPPAKEKRGKRKTLRVDIKAGDNTDTANVKVNIPLSIVKVLSPLLKSGVIPDEVKEKMQQKGISVDMLTQIVDQITDELGEAGEEIVNIDAGDGTDGATVKVYVE